jgi:hypothetical protein
MMPNDAQDGVLGDRHQTPLQILKIAQTGFIAYKTQ